jgi:hypothetical protein
MLKRIKDYVEKKVSRPVSTEELEAAFDDAKNNIACNYLLLGYDVTAKDFMNTFVNCIRVNRLNKTPKEKAGILTIIDQAGQTKHIVGVTIMEYNKNTVFGIGVDGRKLWLGKYNTAEEAENIKNIIDTCLTEKRRCDLRYLE